MKRNLLLATLVVCSLALSANAQKKRALRPPTCSRGRLSPRTGRRR